MRLLKTRWQSTRYAVEICNKAKCRVYRDIDEVGATLPVGVFVYGCFEIRVRRWFRPKDATWFSISKLALHARPYNQ